MVGISEEEEESMSAVAFFFDFVRTKLCLVKLMFLFDSTVQGCGRSFGEGRKLNVSCCLF